MPCFDGREDEDRRAAAKRYGQMQEMLCEASNLIKDAGVEHLMGANLRAWWIQHQREDAARQNAAQEKINLQKIANEAVQGMTSEQIEALRVIHGLKLRK